jgi:hypothetical protein
MLSIERAKLNNKRRGESVAGIKLDDDRGFFAPTHAVSSTEVGNAQKIRTKCGVNVVLPNEMVDVKWFWTKDGFSAFRFKGREYDDYIGYVNEMVKESQAKIGIYTPTFNSSITDGSKKVNLTERICEDSEVSFITLREGSTPNYTRLLIDRLKRRLKQEKIEKDILLYIDTDQKEEWFKAKNQLASQYASGVIWKYCPLGLRPENYVNMTTYGDKPDFLRVITDAPRTYPRQGRASVSTNLFWFADVVGLARPFGFSDDPEEIKRKQKQRKISAEEIAEKALANAMQYDDELDAYLTRADLESIGKKKFAGCPLHEKIDNNSGEFSMEYEKMIYWASITHSIFHLHKRLTTVRDAILKSNLIPLLKQSAYTKKVSLELLNDGLGTQKLI